MVRKNMKKNNLRKIRRQQDVSQYELALRSGISQSSLSLFENHFQSPNDEQKRKIALALRAPIEAIFPKNDLDVISNE